MATLKEQENGKIIVMICKTKDNKTVERPYVTHSENVEFAESFIEEEECKLYSKRFKNKGKNYSFEEQAIYNIFTFGSAADSLDKLLNLACTYKTEYKIPNMFKTINTEFEKLERIYKKTKKSAEEEKKRAAELPLEDFKEKIFLTEDLKSVKEEYLNSLKVPNFNTKNFIYRTIKYQKAGKTKERELIHIKKNAASKEKLEFYYDQINKMLYRLFDLEPNMFGVGKGVPEAVAEIANSKLAVKLDLKNFFNSVKKEQIFKGFKECCKVKLKDNVIKQIIRVGTPLGRPYQGQKTSTILCYIALLPLIKELNKEDSNKKAVYIDDIFIKQEGTFGEAIIALKKYKEKFKEKGFVLNEKKCKVLHGNKVFFLGVNLQTNKLGYNAYIQKLKPKMWRFYDFYYLAKTQEMRNKKRRFLDKPLYIKTKIKEAQEIVGKVNYIKQIDEQQFQSIINHKKYGMIYKKALEVLSYVKPIQI